MDGHPRRLAQERKTCLKTLRTARMARRALVLPLLADGPSYRDIGAATFASPTRIGAVKRDFAVGRSRGVLGTEAKSATVASWLVVVVQWLLQLTPQDFGFLSRCPGLSGPARRSNRPALPYQICTRDCDGVSSTQTFCSSRIIRPFDAKQL
jgi:hypothetical protein